MPILRLFINHTLTPDQRESLYSEVTDAVQSAVDAPRSNVRIILSEVPPGHIASTPPDTTVQLAGTTAGSSYEG